MGLDMYAYSVAEDFAPSNEVPTREEWNLLFEDTDAAYSKPSQFHYWRKHPDLHGWMENLYRKKGGTEEDFNCVPVRLTEEDLDDLEEVVRGKDLPFTEGFFFGKSGPEDKENDLAFIREARIRISEGYAVFYDSWW